jgi:hypothetical protein
MDIHVVNTKSASPPGATGLVLMTRNEYSLSIASIRDFGTNNNIKLLPSDKYVLRKVKSFGDKLFAFPREEDK